MEERPSPRKLELIWPLGEGNGQMMPLAQIKQLMHLAGTQAPARAAATLEPLLQLGRLPREGQSAVTMLATALAEQAGQTEQTAYEARDTLGKLRKLSAANPENEKAALFYARMLLNFHLSYHQNRIQNCMPELKALYEAHPAEEMAEVYASGLAFLTRFSEADNAVAGIREVEEFTKRYPENERLRFVYACALMYRCERAADPECLARLETLSQQEGVSVAGVYAKALLAESPRQGYAELWQTAARLRQLYIRRKDSTFIALAYAKGLARLAACAPEPEPWFARLRELSAATGSEEIRAVYLRLRIILAEREGRQALEAEVAALCSGKENEAVLLRCVAYLAEAVREEGHGAHDRFFCFARGVLHIKGAADAFAQALLSLMDGQRLEQAKQLLERLRALAERFPSREEVARCFVRGVFTVACYDPAQTLRQAVQVTLPLSEKFPQSEEMALLSSRMLLGVFLEKPQEQAAFVRPALKRVADRFAANAELAEYYAVSLAFLYPEQSEEDAALSEKELDGLCARFPQNERLRRFYENLLMHLASGAQKGGPAYLFKLEARAQSGPDAAVFYAVALRKRLGQASGQSTEISLAQRLASLLERYPNGYEIAQENALALFARFQQTNEEETLARIKALAVRYQKGVAAIYAHALLQPEQFMPAKERIRALEETAEFCRTEPENELLALAYARGLFALAFDQSGYAAEETVARIRGVYSNFQGSEGIAAVYANALRNLTVDQQADRLPRTIAQLERVLSAHPTGQIAQEYAGGLYNAAVKCKENGWDYVIRLKTLAQRCRINSVQTCFARMVEDSVERYDAAGRKTLLSMMREVFGSLPTGDSTVVGSFAAALFFGAQDPESMRNSAQALFFLNRLNPEHELAAVYCLRMQYALALKNDPDAAKFLSAFYERHAPRAPGWPLERERALVAPLGRETTRPAQFCLDLMHALYRSLPSRETALALATGLAHRLACLKEQDFGVLRQLEQIYARFKEEPFAYAYARGICFTLARTPGPGGRLQRAWLRGKVRRLARKWKGPQLAQCRAVALGPHDIRRMPRWFPGQ